MNYSSTKYIKEKQQIRHAHNIGYWKMAGNKRAPAAERSGDFIQSCSMVIFKIPKLASVKPNNIH